MAAIKRYALDQCALYKIGSKRRLSQLIGLPVLELRKLAVNTKNYREFTLPRVACPFGGKDIEKRQVQQPKPTLRLVHLRLHKLLSRITPPAYAYGAVKGRSYRSNALSHEKARRIATFDIRAFFPSTSREMVRSFFADRLCCAPDIADLLVDLCCFQNKHYKGGLPTGSPLSPILSLYANQPVFDALHAYAEQHGVCFTAYIDDLTFSGPTLPRGLKSFVELTVGRFGHSLSLRKTKIFRSDRPKRVTGVVISDSGIRVPHERFKKARAITAAIKLENNIEEKYALQQKLAGLLGEAAFLDSQYSDWAAHSYLELKALRDALK